MKYFSAELHCHTIHSDGNFTPEELQHAAVNDGLSLVALTDHNTFSGWQEMNPEICPFIRGTEWTTYFGHMLVLGAEHFVDWRDAVPDNIDGKIRQVKAANGLVGIAHPFQAGSPICTGGRWEFNVQNWENVDYMEIWHEDFSPENTENDRATVLWTELLDRGFRIAAAYGRDWHRPQCADRHYGCTYIGIESGHINEKTALEALRRGRTVVSAGAQFSFCVEIGGNVYYLGDDVPCGEADIVFSADVIARRVFEQKKSIEYKTIRVITNGGKTVLETPPDTPSVHFSLEKNHWYRAELWGTLFNEEKPLAITSPVYSV